MSRTRHHNSQDYGFYWERRSPAWYKRLLNSLYRAEIRNLMRKERYDVLPRPKRRDAVRF